MNGAITFGKLSPKGDVTSSVHIQALDGRHFMLSNKPLVSEFLLVT